MWTKPTPSAYAASGAWLRRGIRLYPRHRLSRRYIRQGGCVRRRLHRMQKDGTGVSRKPHAHTYFHHRAATRKHSMDTVCCTPTGRYAGTARTSGAYRPNASRSPASPRIYMSRRQPYRSDDCRTERGYRPAGRGFATARLLRPARPPADSAGRNITHPFFADSGNQKRGDRRINELPDRSYSNLAMPMTNGIKTSTVFII